MTEMKNVKEVEKAVDEAVNAMLQIKSFQELLKDIIDSTSEKYEVDKKWFRNCASKKYKKLYDSEKYQAEKDMVEDIYDFLDGEEEFN